MYISTNTNVYIYIYIYIAYINIIRQAALPRLMRSGRSSACLPGSVYTAITCIYPPNFIYSI